MKKPWWVLAFVCLMMGSEAFAVGPFRSNPLDGIRCSAQVGDISKRAKPVTDVKLRRTVMNSDDGASVVFEGEAGGYRLVAQILRSETLPVFMHIVQPNGVKVQSSGVLADAEATTTLMLEDQAVIECGHRR